MEKNALMLLQKPLENLIVKETQGYLDDELRIDLIITDLNNNTIGGIQVKPKTFSNMRSEVLFMQKKQNQKWQHPVWFLFYNKNSEFENLDLLINSIKKIEVNLYQNKVD